MRRDACPDTGRRPRASPLRLQQPIQHIPSLAQFPQSSATPRNHPITARLAVSEFRLTLALRNDYARFTAQRPPHPAPRYPFLPSPESGNVTVNKLPRPKRDDAVRLPPCACAIHWL